MKILKLSTDNRAEIIEVENIFDYATELFGSTHLDIRSKMMDEYVLIFDDAVKDETTNLIASILYNGKIDSMWGTCLLVKVSNEYKIHGDYKSAISIDIEN